MMELLIFLAVAGLLLLANHLENKAQRKRDEWSSDFPQRRTKVKLLEKPKFDDKGTSVF